MERIKKLLAILSLYASLGVAICPCYADELNGEGGITISPALLRIYFADGVVGEIATREITSASSVISEKAGGSLSIGWRSPDEKALPEYSEQYWTIDQIQMVDRITLVGQRKTADASPHAGRIDTRLPHATNIPQANSTKSTIDVQSLRLQMLELRVDQYQYIVRESLVARRPEAVGKYEELFKKVRNFSVESFGIVLSDHKEIQIRADSICNLYFAEPDGVFVVHWLSAKPQGDSISPREVQPKAYNTLADVQSDDRLMLIRSMPSDSGLGVIVEPSIVEPNYERDGPPVGRSEVITEAELQKLERPLLEPPFPLSPVQITSVEPSGEGKKSVLGDSEVSPSSVVANRIDRLEAALTKLEVTIQLLLGIEGD